MTDQQIFELREQVNLSTRKAIDSLKKLRDDERNLDAKIKDKNNSLLFIEKNVRRAEASLERLAHEMEESSHNLSQRNEDVNAANIRVSEANERAKVILSEAAHIKSQQEDAYNTALDIKNKYDRKVEELKREYAIVQAAKEERVRNGKIKAELEKEATLISEKMDEIDKKEKSIIEKERKLNDKIERLNHDREDFLERKADFEKRVAGFSRDKNELSELIMQHDNIKRESQEAIIKLEEKTAELNVSANALLSRESRLSIAENKNKEMAEKLKKDNQLLRLAEAKVRSVIEKIKKQRSYDAELEALGIN